MELREEIKGLEAELIELRRDIHMYPELGTQEQRTSDLVERYLKEIGIETTRLCETGVVGLIRGERPGKTILLRADMDALPIEEINELPYKSRVEGVMHACGHDAHTAMLMVAAKVLYAHREDLCGNVKLVFQLNEEMVLPGMEESGAVSMVKAGVLKNPDVDASFGIHLSPLLNVGALGLTAGAVNGAMASFDMVVTGKSGHTSKPHLSVDPIICASAMVQSAQLLQTREINPMDTTVIMFGTIHGGASCNSIPEDVTMSGSIRYMYDGGDDTFQKPLKRFDRLMRSIANTYNTEVEITFTHSNNAVINDADFVEFLRSRVVSNVTALKKVEKYVSMGGEDFSEFSCVNNIPGAMVYLGSANKELGSDKPDHSSFYKVDESCLAIGVELHVRTALEYLSKN